MENKLTKAEIKPEINISSLIDNARIYIDKDIHQSTYLINLVLTYNDLDINSELISLGIKSYFAFKSKNDNSLVRIFNKFLKNKKEIIAETSLSYIRVLYRVGSIFFENKKLFLSALAFYSAQKFYEHNKFHEIKDSEDTINSKMSETIKEINTQLEKDKQRYEDNIDFFLVLKDKITNNIKNFHISNQNVKYYVISTVWVENLMNFIENNSKKIEKKFDKSQVCLCYFSDRVNDYTGAYPGPINNFFLLNFNEVWLDPHPNYLHTNLILKNNMKEKTDYFLLERKDYEDLKTYFDSYYDIERNSIEFNDELIVEVNLFKIKVLVFSDILNKDIYLHLISPRYLQLSRKDTIKDFKEKIIRCLNNVLKEEHQFTGGFDIKMYNPSRNSNQNLIFELIYSFVNRHNKHIFEGEEIIDENVMVSVK